MIRLSKYIQELIFACPLSSGLAFVASVQYVCIYARTIETIDIVFSSLEREL